VQTAEGELQVEIPQLREAAETFASKLLRTEPLKALVLGAFVRGLWEVNAAAVRHIPRRLLGEGGRSVSWEST
jgi:hypothetical protein